MQQTSTPKLAAFFFFSKIFKKAQRLQFNERNVTLQNEFIETLLALKNEKELKANK